MPDNDPSHAGERILERVLESEMRGSFIDYAMSVNMQRALPDVRDGLKPVHRRILYAMHELGLTPGRAYKKCATVVGEVLGKYHPHGDSAVYDALVRMVQDFSLRYPLVDGQGNFGSIDGDSAAAYRYTEARLQRLSVELLADIGKRTVEFAENYDGRLEEPRVLPSKAPNLLINGSSGIAVGMATNVPPHNLREVVRALLALIDDPELPQERLEALVPGPDFPTGGIICGREGVREAYRNGQGRIVMRAKADIEEEDDGSARIVVREIPFMINKSRLMEQIAGLVRDKKLTSIRDMRDESDRDGLRMVLELKRGAVPQVVLNRLYKHTQMQATFGAIFLALVDGRPRRLSLREMLQHFVDHRHEVVVKRSEFDVAAAREREHVLEGLRVAVENIDEVVKVIRGSRDADEAAPRLRTAFELSERQARAILDMRLARLTGLEIEKLDAELAGVKAEIAELERILGSREVRMGIVKDELRDLAERYGDDRRTEIAGAAGSFDVEDLIVDEQVVITISRDGYVKRIPLDTYKAQRRGGRGLRGVITKAEDVVDRLFVASTHDYLMVFTDWGRCHWIKVWAIPQGSRQARGKPFVNLLQLGHGESVAAVEAVREFREDRFLFFCTKRGIVKRTPLSAFKNVRAIGIIAIRIAESDELIDVRVTDGSNEVLLGTRRGKAILFSEKDVRPRGRVAGGVRGIRLDAGDEVAGMIVVRREGASVLVVTEKGMGKRTKVEDYRFQRRGGKGVINLKFSDKADSVVAVKSVTDTDQLMVITRNGVVNRQKASEIRVNKARATKGVRLVNLDAGDEVVDVARLLDEEVEGEGKTDGDGEACGATAPKVAQVAVVADKTGGQTVPQAGEGADMALHPGKEAQAGGKDQAALELPAAGAAPSGADTPE